MKIFVKISFTALFAMILTVSCQKEVNDIRYPEFKLKLIINGSISPEIINNYISVDYNHRIYGELYTSYAGDMPGDLTATLSSEDKQYSLRPTFNKYQKTNGTEISFDSVKSGFVFDNTEIPVEEGKKYTLKVQSESGLSASASCTIPFKRNFALKIDTQRIISNDPQYSMYSHYEAYLNYTDTPGEQNYYRLLGEIVRYSHIYGPSISSNNIVPPENSFFTDKGYDGKTSKITFSYIPNSASDDSVFIKIYLLNTDKTYYDYHKSIEKYSSGEDPFTEPSPLYTNVTGGLGIFASYTIDSLVFRLK
jgi:hypothetical protein